MTTHVEALYGISPEDEHELMGMLQMLTSTNGFQLQAAECDLPAAQKACIRWIERQSAVHGKAIVVIDLTLKQIDNLRVHIQAELKDLYPEGIPLNLVLMVVGLEWSIVLDHDEYPTVLRNLNVEPQQYQRGLPYPIILWLPSVARKTLERFKPDDVSWTRQVYQFTRRPSSSTSEAASAYQDDSALESKTKEIRLLKRLRGQLPSLMDDTSAEIKRLHRDWAYRLGEAYQAVEHHDQAIPLLRKTLDLDAEDTWQHAARVHHAIGVSFWQSEQIGYAINSFDRALSISQERGDKYLEYTAFGNLGTIYNDLSSYDSAIDYYEKALVISRELGDRRGESVLLGNLGVTYENQGNFESSIRQHEAALSISREFADASNEAKHLGNLGGAYGKHGDWQTAIDYFEEALSVSQATGDQRTEGAWLGNLGATYSRLGDDKTALRYYEKALFISRELGDRQNEGLLLGKLGLIHRRLGNDEVALACFNALKIIGIAIKAPEVVGWVEEDIERLKVEMGEEKFERLKSEVQARQTELIP